MEDDKLPDIASSLTQSGPPAADDDHVTLPALQKKEIDSSTESLIKALGLAGADEKSLGRLLKTVRGQVLATLDELRTITTHDDNLEKQYKEVVSENVQLNSALEKARGEIRHLKGQLTVLQMTTPEIRKYRARTQMRERRRQDHEHQLQQSRQKYVGVELMPLLDFAERARTVNARGEYIDRRQMPHSRHSTYPPPASLQPSTIPLPVPTKSRPHPLPPPLLGCRCSVCSAQQSLGALTLGPKHLPLSQSLPHQSSPHLTRSGQQILLGDRVIVKGERPGIVRYIGRLEADVQGQLFIGVHLIKPVGTCDGSMRGRQYFQCPPHHGVFVRPTEVVCVTGRKPCTGGTVVPRIQEKAPLSGGSKQQSPLQWGQQEQELPTPPSTRTASTMTQAHALLQEELAQAKAVSTPNELFDPSVQEMRRRMEELAQKNRQRLASKQQPTQETENVTPPTQSSPSPVEEEVGPATQPTPPPPISPPPPAPPSPSPSLPPTPSPPPPPAEEEVRETTPLPPPPRSETPLPTILLRELQAKDLGSTGFVTGNELSAILTQLSKGKAMSEEETEDLLVGLGIPRTESGGFLYTDIIPYLVQAIEGQ